MPNTRGRPGCRLRGAIRHAEIGHAASAALEGVADVALGDVEPIESPVVVGHTRFPFRIVSIDVRPSSRSAQLCGVRNAIRFRHPPYGGLKIGSIGVPSPG